MEVELAISWICSVELGSALDIGQYAMSYVKTPYPHWFSRLLRGRNSETCWIIEGRLYETDSRNHSL